MARKRNFKIGQIWKYDDAGEQVYYEVVGFDDNNDPRLLVVEPLVEDEDNEPFTYNRRWFDEDGPVWSLTRRKSRYTAVEEEKKEIEKEVIEI